MNILKTNIQKLLWINIVFNSDPERIQDFRSMRNQIQTFDDKKLDNFTA
jgi:hypothetical protein